MMTYSKFSYKLHVILLSCGIKDMAGIDEFIAYSYRKYINPNNRETEEDKRNKHLFQRIYYKIALSSKSYEYNNLITNNKTEI